MDTAYLLLYVDGIVLTASSLDLLQRIISSLHHEFAMTDLGPLNYFLGIFVTLNSFGLFLSQAKYAGEILEKAHMGNCNPSRTPVDTESKLGVDGDPVSDPTLYQSLTVPVSDKVTAKSAKNVEVDEPLVGVNNYQKLVGKLIYLTLTRPDISHSVHCLSQVMHAPTKKSLKSAFKVLRHDLQMKREKIQDGIVKTAKVKSVDNIVDVFTKGAVLDKLEDAGRRPIKKLLNAKGKNKVNGKGKDKKVYIPKPNNPKSTAMERPAKDDACHHFRASRSNWKFLTSFTNGLSDLFRQLHVSRQGASYFITFTDDYSRYGYVYLLKHKHEVFETFKVFKNEVENQLGKTIKAIRSDRGGEYISQEFKDYLKANGIVQQLTPPYTPQHNGVSERRNRTLLDMVRSMMNLTTLPLSFWDYALESATRILNMVPTKKVDKTPYELWYGKVPNLSYLKVWGCEALVKRDTPDKLEQRSVKCIFIGYPKETMGYYFYFPPENKIVVARYAEFFEKRLISQEISGRAVDLEEIQEEEDTTPSEITSNIPQEVEGFEPPQEEVIPIRRSERTHRVPNRLCLNVEVEEHSLGDLNEPTSYKAAMLDSESNKWIDAMNAEIQSMMDNMAWVLSSSSWLKVCKLQRSIYGLKKRQEAGIKDLMKKSKGEPHWTAVKNILKYLRNTKDMFLVYGGNPSTKLRVECYCDAGFETDRDTLVVDRYVSLMNEGAVDWKSSKQSTTAMSATESEYIAASEAVWIRKFISGLVQKGARHYQRRYHYVRECVELGEIKILKVHTDNNLADPFTKALSNRKLTQHARGMGLRPASSFM
ncbi:retrotransposon protein, putative, ty1-copia subclass [Tanacetum coccineum]